MNNGTILSTIKKGITFLKKRNVSKRRIVLIFSIILLAGLTYAAFTNVILKKTIVAATTQIPESFTELYFEDHTELPTKVIKKAKYPWNPDQISYSFAFTITNRENKEMNYTYEVYREADGTNKKTFIDKGKVFIYNNNSKKITENYTMPNIYPRTKIVVNLIEQKQPISFWMKGEEK